MLKGIEMTLATTQDNGPLEASFFNNGTLISPERTAHTKDEEKKHTPDFI